MIAALVTLGGYLLAGPASTPRICDGCGRTWTRLTPTQAAQVGADRLPECRRWSCHGRLWPVTERATDRFLTDLTNTTGGTP